eukprot:365651-Chlamydomonas_euryale.AAC.7
MPCLPVRTCGWASAIAIMCMRMQSCPVHLCAHATANLQSHAQSDAQGYTPSLLVSEYKTLVSLIVSLLVLGAFLTSVGYTLAVWATAVMTQTETIVVHSQSVALVPPDVVNGAAGGGLLPLPLLGILMVLGNGTAVDWVADADNFKLTFEQVSGALDRACPMVEAGLEERATAD